MLLEIVNGTVSRGGNKVLEGFSFSIKGTEKIAIVGKNGAGKSTLLEVIDGTCPMDRIDGHPEADVRFSRAVTIGRFRQTAAPEDEDKTADDFVREAAAMQHIPAESPLFSSLTGDFFRSFTRLGFRMEDRKKKLSVFSGGEKAKILLLRLLFVQPDLLLLDEPTNHLDLETVEWLEEAVRRYPKAVVFVSHDRYFIDRTADLVWEVSGGKLTRYAGNYSAYREEKYRRRERLEKQYAAQQEEIARLEDLIRRFRSKPRKAAFARSRARLLERMDRLPRPEMDDARIHTEEIVPAHTGSKNVLDCDKLCIGYGKEQPLRRVSFRLKRGQKIGIFGPNGTGKSTFLKTLAGLIPQLSGKLSVSESADIAYFDQMSAELTSDLGVFDYFHDRFPALTGKEVRQTLAGYLFGPEDLGKKVRELSGGQRARLCLAIILQAKPNVLLLDEPTNNMDIPARETLESIFRMYKGTLVFISHDRYFLSHVAEELLYFPPKTDQVLYCPYGYELFREKQRKGAASGDAAAMRTAEEQRMIEELRAVPRGNSMLSGRLSTASLQLDWEYDQNRAVRLPAEEAFRLASEAYENREGGADRPEDREGEAGRPEDREGVADRPEDRECQKEQNCRKTAYSLEEYMSSDGDVQREAALRQQLEEARDAWTKELLGWYDIYQETED